MRASFFSVGCKLNNCEIEVLQRQFAGSGWDVVPCGETADVTVINTCTVTQCADADCRKLIRKVKTAQPDTRVVVTGCLAERRPDELAGMPDVSLVVGNKAKRNLLRLVDDATREGFGESVPPVEDETPGFLPVAPAIARFPWARTRATIQVQDGCDEHCTYCAIPGVRGRSRSRPLVDIVAETEALLEGGYRELALTGVNTGAWGQDIGVSEGVIVMVDAVLCAQTASGRMVERLRLNSLEPKAVTNALIDRMAAEPRVCRHWHIPLQSGSDGVLKRMGRRYRAQDYAETIEMIRQRMPDAAIGADVMVGFPGETDAEFGETVALLRRLPVTYLHVFPYSVREGTPASRLGDRAPLSGKRERSAALRELGAEKRLAFHVKHVGSLVDVLLEGGEGNSEFELHGLTGNYIRVSVEAPAELANCFASVRVTEASASGVRGVLAEGATTASGGDGR